MQDQNPAKNAAPARAGEGVKAAAAVAEIQVGEQHVEDQAQAQDGA